MKNIINLFGLMLNLQLFAEINTNVTTDEGLSAENKTASSSRKPPRTWFMTSSDRSAPFPRAAVRRWSSASMPPFPRLPSR